MAQGLLLFVFVLLGLCISSSPRVPSLHSFTVLSLSFLPVPLIYHLVILLTYLVWLFMMSLVYVTHLSTFPSHLVFYASFYWPILQLTDLPFSCV